MLPDLWYVQTRPTEIGLTLFCVGYGIYLIALPEAAFASQVLSGIAWLGYGPIAGLPFIGKAIFTGWGVLANIRGWRFSQFLRWFGAAIGSSIWAWMIYQDYDIDQILTSVSFVAGLFLLSSLWVMVMAMANLPRPGNGV